MSLKPRDVVRDRSSGRVGIVMERAYPDARWIRDQAYSPVAALSPSAVWWTVLPLGGGAIIAAEAFAETLREATWDDFLEAVDHGNEHARRKLAWLFPDFVRQALRAAKSSAAPHGSGRR